jgi:uncharacterized protein involved in exopolysaccharide biosynthesis
MRPSPRGLLIAAAVLVVAGVVAFALQPGEPTPVCARDGAPTSGFVDEAQDDCPISVESWAEISDYRSEPKVFRVAGLVLLVGGVALGGGALLAGRRDQL